MSKKILEAKQIDVPSRVWEQLNNMTSAREQNLSAILADMGETRRRDAYAIAIGLSHPFNDLLEIYPTITGKKVGLESFSVILGGLMISYVLGLGEWEKEIPVFSPKSIKIEDVKKYGAVKLRSGKIVDMDELLMKLMSITSQSELEPVFKNVFSKTITGKFKRLSAVDCVEILLAMISIADQL